ncbi:MAG: HK97 family phage prohead protease [Sciscionella sp.]
MADAPNLDVADAGQLNQAARKVAIERGWSMPDGSYPIRPLANHGRDDLQKAIHAVGRGGASHDAIRKHIMARAKALGLSDLIPSNWNSNGSPREQPMADVERRYTPEPVEARQADGRRKIAGYAAVFNSESRNLGGFIESVDPLAFNKSRGDGWPDVVARYNHDDNMLLGTTAARTLQLGVDEHGLSYVVDPPQSRTDILELVERGDVRKSSFAFRAIDDDWTLTDQGFPKRSLLGVQLVDVAPVNIPAYADTSAGLRSLAVHMQAPLDEVRKLAADNELRKFFVRTDNSGKPVSKTYGPAARMAILGKRDPWGA